MQDKYKGYEAVNCSNATWRDYDNSKKPIEYYKLDLITPYPSDMAEADLLKRLQFDLGEIFGGIGHYDLIETNKRAFRMVRDAQDIRYAHNCFGAVCRLNFKHARWEVTLMLHELFRGFPDANEE